MAISDIRTLSRLEFLKRAFNKLYSEDVSKALLQAAADSSIKQYESNWKSFATWLPESTTSINRPLVLAYLTELSKTLAPRTVLVHRNALKLPLELGFNIDFSHNHFSLLAKSHFRRAPPKKKLLPSWSLEKALVILRSRVVSNQDILARFLKTIFLIAVASANRAAELAAIDRKTILFRGNKASLGVRSDFVFKNQSLMCAPSNIEIPGLQGDTLCPLRSLKAYLELTKDSSEPSLFIHPKTGKSLNAAGISYWLAKSIDWLLPGCLGKGHDIRKLVTSHAWYRGVPANEIVAAGSWTSLCTFIKKYLCFDRPKGFAVIARTVC